MAGKGLTKRQYNDFLKPYRPRQSIHDDENEDENDGIDYDPDGWGEEHTMSGVL
jgi:hypothetical protein